MSQENFNHAMQIIFEVEGGYSNRPVEADPGGETNFGISSRAHTNVDIKGLTPDKAQQIYFEDYWRKPRINQLDWPQCLLVFDYGIHSGPRHAIIQIQRLLGLRTDGVIGPITTRSVNRMSNYRMRKYLVDRLNYLRSLPNWDDNDGGWQYRIVKIAGYIPTDF